MKHKKKMGAYHVFNRVWWKRNTEWPDGREPHAGRKTTMGYCGSEAEARVMCKDYNDSHDPGPMSRKAEYEEI